MSPRSSAFRVTRASSVTVVVLCRGHGGSTCRRCSRRLVYVRARVRRVGRSAGPARGNRVAAWLELRATQATRASGHVVGFVDIGTNSVRLMLVRISATGWPTSVINLQREVVRLGEEEFGDHLLRPAAIERAVPSAARSPSWHAVRRGDEIVAVATSATREARNQGAVRGASARRGRTRRARRVRPRRGAPHLPRRVGAASSSASARCSASTSAAAAPR